MRLSATFFSVRIVEPEDFVLAVFAPSVWAWEDFHHANPRSRAARHVACMKRVRGVLKAPTVTIWNLYVAVVFAFTVS